MFSTKNTLMVPIYMALSIIAIVVTVHAHENHAQTAPETDKNPMTASEEEVLKRINAEYVKEVKPIFQKSCYDCHSSSTNYPWYAKLPGAKQLIEKDIRESKEHLDLTNDFPFGGHGTPVEDLEAISKSVNDGSMPPFRYRLMHPKSGLSNEEKSLVSRWVEKSISELRSSSSKNSDSAPSNDHKAH